MTPNERCCPRCNGCGLYQHLPTDKEGVCALCHGTGQAPTSEQSEAMKGGDETCAEHSPVSVRDFLTEPKTTCQAVQTEQNTASNAAAASDPLLAATRITELENAIRRIRALETVEMGDYAVHEPGLRPDDVFDICDEVLPPTP